MLSIPYTTLVLAAGIGSLAAAANAAESYDLTNCAASTVTTVSATEELTVMSLDNKGIARSNSANKAFDNATFECAYVVSVAGAQRSGLGYCKFMAPDGDFFVARRCLTRLVAENGSSCRVQESGRVSWAAANMSR
jgi:hypothetical protein